MSEHTLSALKSVLNGWDTAKPTAERRPMFLINVLLSQLTESEGVMHWDELHSRRLIYWLPFPLV